MCRDLREAEALAEFRRWRASSAERFWPGALTLVLPRRAGQPRLSLLVSAGLDTVAVRAPSHPVARELLAARGRAAGRAQRQPLGPRQPDDRRACRRRDSAAQCRPDPRWRRHAAGNRIDRRRFRERTGRCCCAPARSRAKASRRSPDRCAAAARRRHRSPGQLASHYAPHARAAAERARTSRRDEALLAFGPDVPEARARRCNLSARGDLNEAAANLFAMLRALDAPARARIAVMPIPELGWAKRSTTGLRRAAAPRAAP